MMAGWATMARKGVAAYKRHERNVEYNNTISNSYENYSNMKTIDEDQLIELHYNKQTKVLNFIIQHFHSEPKIVRYTQRNYERTPIYDGTYTNRTKVVKRFSKIINPTRFVNYDILELGIDKDFINQIITEINIIPVWRKQELLIEDCNNKIIEQLNLVREYHKEKQEFTPKEVNYNEKPSNFWLRLIFVPFTLGFSFLTYLSKNQADIHKEWNEQNKKWNKDESTKIKLNNQMLHQEIENHNNKLKEKVDKLIQERTRLENENLVVEVGFENGWLDLIDSSNLYYPNLTNKKGVYIIWNRTKNIYYVGQSKNMKSRLMNHFKDGEPKNIVFAKDFYDGDNFAYKYYFCETKDELDALEKRYIEEYDSFNNGYNKTGGNK